MHNGFIELFDRTYREAVLDMYVFNNQEEVREHTYKWFTEFNEYRPHESLGGLTPREYLFRHHPEASVLRWY
jgi:putative transposase